MPETDFRRPAPRRLALLRPVNGRPGPALTRPSRWRSFERRLRLRGSLLASLPPAECEEGRDELIALCARVAEVSGGETGFAAGAARL